MMNTRGLQTFSIKRILDECPFWISTVYILYLGIHDSRICSNYNSLAFIFIFFCIIMSTGIILGLKDVKLLIRNAIASSSAKFEYFFISISAILLCIAVFLRIYAITSFPKEKQYSIDYFIYVVLGSAVSNFNAFMLIRRQRKEHP